MRCTLCPHACLLRQEGAVGRCRARVRRGAGIEPLNRHLISALALDPIEKKPLHAFHPGSMILSVGGFGCNMACYFCQNAQIACAAPDGLAGREMTPKALVKEAERLRPLHNIGLAFTYNEPLINPELILACAPLLRDKGLKLAVVTNGCFHVEAMAPVFKAVDAWNIDLKGFSAPWYERLGGDLHTVQAFISEAVLHAHVELTTLVVPGENDSVEEMEALASWVASLSPAIPLHLSRFFPRHRAGGAPTPRDTLLKLQEIASRRLHTVLLGNV